MTVVLVDAGPLVALIDRGDTHHLWASETYAGFIEPLVTCDAALTEASFVLGPGTTGCDALFDFVERDLVRSGFELQPHVHRVRALMARYASVPMSFADACLVRMTELYSDVVVWTLDSDFQIYRRHGRQRIPTITPRR